MKRSEIRDFLKDGVSKINPQLHFYSGVITDWNKERGKLFPSTFYESLIEMTGEVINHLLPSDTYPVSLHIGKQDKLDSLPDQYETIIDDCDYIAQQLFRQYNQVITNHDRVSIEGYSREPFLKKGADCISGVILKFNLKGADTTKLC